MCLCRAPLNRGRGAIDNDMAQLVQIAFSVKVGNAHATDRESNAGSGENYAFDGGSVIAPNGTVRAVSPSSESALAEAPEASRPQAIIIGVAIIEILKLCFFM
jgi:hypothetical protein